MKDMARHEGRPDRARGKRDVRMLVKLYSKLQRPDLRGRQLQRAH